MLNENDLSVLDRNLNRIIILITDYGCLYSPDMSRLKLIQKNINIFKECKEGWDELQKYMLEDWNAAMRSQERIIDCHILSDDIDLKAKYNVELEECFRILDQFFETHWINKRIWYTKQDLFEFGKKYKNREKDWNIVMKELEAADRYCVSPIELIPHDIWSFANMLGVAATDDALVEWFLMDVPAFGYLSPMQILGVAGGDPVFLQNENLEVDAYQFCMQIYGADFPEEFQDIFYLNDSVGYLFLNKQADENDVGLFFTQCS